MGDRLNSFASIRDPASVHDSSTRMETITMTAKFAIAAAALTLGVALGGPGPFEPPRGKGGKRLLQGRPGLRKSGVGSEKIQSTGARAGEVE